MSTHIESLDTRGARRLAAACAIGLSGLVLLVGPLAAEEQNATDGHPRWTESLGQPSVYVNYARVEVGKSRYKAAAWNLRKAATMLANRSTNTYGLDRRHLRLDVAALRLTARDVAAGAVANPAQLDSVLNTTRSELSEHRSAR